MPRNNSDVNLHPRAVKAREREAARQQQAIHDATAREQQEILDHDIGNSKKTQRLLAKQDKQREAAEKREKKKTLQEIDDVMCTAKPKGKFAKTQVSQPRMFIQFQYNIRYMLSLFFSFLIYHFIYLF